MWFDELNQCQRPRELGMEDIVYGVRLVTKIRPRANRVVFLGWPAVCGHLNGRKHTKNHPEQGPRQKVEHPAGLDEILQFSDDSRHNILTVASRVRLRPAFSRDRLTNSSKPLQLYVSLQVGSHCAYSVSPAHDSSPWSGSLQTITTHWSVHWAVSWLVAHPERELQSAQGEFAGMYGLAGSKVIIGKSQRESEDMLKDTQAARRGSDDRRGPHFQLCNQWHQC